MKKRIITLGVIAPILILILMVRCEGNSIINEDTCLPEGWEPIPTDRIKSYLPAVMSATKVDFGNPYEGNI